MRPYQELNAHHIGKSHVQNGLRCEDYSLTYSDEQVSIIAVSDGHGDKNCFRSEKGAAYACETAIHECRRFQRITSHIDDIAHCDFESLVVSLEAEIADAWKAKVLSDAESHPFAPEELSVASDRMQEVYKSGMQREKAYGCTLILAMSTDLYWLALQIGDGKCVAAYPDGVFVEPVPADENCLGNRSTSLCNSNAKESFRHFYSSIRPVAAFVASDGVEESFDQAGLYNCFYSVAYWLKEEGLATARAKLESLLPQISEGGSGDDVSIAVMASDAEAIAKPRQTLEQIYDRVNACQSALDQCNARLADIQSRIEEKDAERARAEAEIAKLRAELADRENERTEIAAERDSLENASEELTARARRISEQVDRANRYKMSAERYWFAELGRLGLQDLSNPGDASKEPLEEGETVALPADDAKPGAARDSALRRAPEIQAQNDSDVSAEPVRVEPVDVEPVAMEPVDAEPVEKNIARAVKLEEEDSAADHAAAKPSNARAKAAVKDSEDSVKRFWLFKKRAKQ